MLTIEKIKEIREVLKIEVSKNAERLCNCQHQIDCWHCGTMLTKDGIISPKLIFSRTKALQYWQSSKLLDQNYHPLPCGKCCFCQIRKRKDMALRLSHERSMHQDCCFITLTYNDKFIPSVLEVKESKTKKYRGKPLLESTISRGVKDTIYTLLPSDVQLFMKRLRRHLEYVPKKVKGVRDHIDKPIRYFCVGEYGSKTERPHYHILIFGYRPSDLQVHQVKEKHIIYRSAQLEKLWKYGFSTVCDVGYGCANYCARYVTKKFAGLQAKKNSVPLKSPEFTLQSVRNGGIGALWLAKNQAYLVNNFVTARTGENRISIFAVPRYYFNRLRKINLPFWLRLRDQKIEFLSKNKPKILSNHEMCNKIKVAIKTYNYQISKEQI